MLTLCKGVFTQAWEGVGMVGEWSFAPDQLQELEQDL